MIKCTYLLKRLPGMSIEDFHSYWRDVHSPIAAKIPGLKRYILCYTLPSQYQANTPFCDGIAELWFDSEEALAKAMKTEEWKVSGADGEMFIAQPSISLLSKEEIII